MKKILTLCILFISINKIFAFGIAGTAGHLMAISNNNTGYNPLNSGMYSDKYLILLVLAFIISAVIIGKKRSSLQC